MRTGEVGHAAPSWKWRATQAILQHVAFPHQGDAPGQAGSGGRRAAILLETWVRSGDDGREKRRISSGVPRLAGGGNYCTDFSSPPRQHFGEGDTAGSHSSAL